MKTFLLSLFLMVCTSAYSLECMVETIEHSTKRGGGFSEKVLEGAKDLTTITPFVTNSTDACPAAIKKAGSTISTIMWLQNIEPPRKDPNSYPCYYSFDEEHYLAKDDRDTVITKKQQMRCKSVNVQ